MNSLLVYSLNLHFSIVEKFCITNHCRYIYMFIFQFGSSVVCTLIHRGEILYNQMSPLDIDNQLQTEWYVDFTFNLLLQTKHPLDHFCGIKM